MGILRLPGAGTRASPSSAARPAPLLCDFLGLSFPLVPAALRPGAARMLSPPAAVAGLSPFGKHARSPAPPPPRPLLSQRPPDFLREPEPRPRTGEDGRAPRVSGGRGGRGGPAWGAFHVATAGREREPTDTWVARRGKGQGPREPGPGGEEWSPRGPGKTEGGGGCPGAAIGLSPSSSCSPRGVLPGAGGWLAAGGGFRARPAPC